MTARSGRARAQPRRPPAGRQRTLLRYVERFALLLRDSGMPPMPARVFAYALADDADRYTAAQLAEGLQVSPAAISGAVRYLVQVGLLARDREPGTNVGVYSLYDEDVWYQIYRSQTDRLRRFQEVAEEGAAVLGATTPGGRRLQQSAEFFSFLSEQYPALMERWHAGRSAGQQRAAHPGQSAAQG